jgi:2-polyprenyl-3-methyl-5-hydroxy-6-metoxy-1,4-benzoquinol methylase
MSPLAELETRLQRLSAELGRLAPTPPGFAALSPVRAALGAELLERRRDEIAAARAACLAGSDGGEALARLAESMVAELRAATADRATGGLLGVAGRLDRAMPTDTVELMDRPSVGEERRKRTIRWMDRMNRRLGTYVLFLSALEPLLDAAPAGSTTTVLDLASGHGGFPLALSALNGGRRKLRIIASDVRPEYVEIGRRRAREVGARDIDFRVVDAFRLGDAFAPGEIDVVTCTQSLHHFGAGGVARLTTGSLRHARRGIVFVDIARTVTLLLAVSVLGAMSLDTAILHDATVSARKAFVPEELALIAGIVPGGESLETLYLPPNFAVMRTRAPASPRDRAAGGGEAARTA